MPREVRYGFEWEDERQERAIGFLQAERNRPGDKHLAYQRSTTRVARHRNKERQWKCARRPIEDHDYSVREVECRRAQVIVHEILETLPSYLKEEIMQALCSGDGRRIRKVGRLVKEVLPGSPPGGAACL